MRTTKWNTQKYDIVVSFRLHFWYFSRLHPAGVSTQSGLARTKQDTFHLPLAIMGDVETGEWGIGNCQDNMHSCPMRLCEIHMIICMHAWIGALRGQHGFGLNITAFCDRPWTAEICLNVIWTVHGWPQNQPNIQTVPEGTTPTPGMHARSILLWLLHVEFYVLHGFAFACGRGAQYCTGELIRK